MPDRSDAHHRALLTLIHAGGAAGLVRGEFKARAVGANVISGEPLPNGAFF